MVYNSSSWNGTGRGCHGPLLSTNGAPPPPATMPSCCSSLDCDEDTDDCDLKKNPKPEKVIHEIEVEVPEGEAREPKGPVSKIPRPLFNPRPSPVPKVSQTLPAGHCSRRQCRAGCACSPQEAAAGRAMPSSAQQEQKQQPAELVLCCLAGRHAAALPRTLSRCSRCCSRCCKLTQAQRPPLISSHHHSWAQLAASAFPPAGRACICPAAGAAP